MKLQQQKMHLGPPPLVLPIRRHEDEGDVPPHMSPEISAMDVPTHAALGKALSQPSQRPLSPVFKPPASKSGAGTTPSPTFTPSVPAVTSLCDSPLDFSSPAKFTPSLDMSAARHRMAVKPRNQRASAKRRVANPDTKAEDMNNYPEPVADKHARDEVILEEQHGFQKCVQPEMFPSRAPLNHALPGRLSPVSSQELQAKLQKRVVVASSETTASSGESEFQVKTLDKSNIVSFNQLSNSVASVASKSSAVCPQDVPELDSLRGLKRPGSGSFHLSITSTKNREERPRSGSFVEVVRQTESRHKTAGPFEDTTPRQRQRDERKDLHPGERHFVVGKPGQEQKSSGFLWEWKDSAKKLESPKTVDLIPSEAAESRRETNEEVVVATKVEVREEEGKTMFGFKLRSTSNSIRFWPDGSSRHRSRKLSNEEQGDGLKRQGSRDIDSLSKNANAGDFTVTDPAISRKPSTESICEAPTLPTDLQTTSLTLSQEPHSTQQTASPEVSWVSLAMEKTRSLHQLFARRFPKDCTNTVSQTATQTTTDDDKPETELSKSPRQTTVHAWKELEVPQSHINTNMTAAQTNPWTTLLPSRSAFRSESPTKFEAVTTIHPPLRSQRGPHPATQQLKTTTASVDEGKRTVQEKESSSFLGKQSIRAGSVSEKAAFLEKQADWCSSPGTKVELRKVHLETKTSSEILAENHDIKPEEREAFKLPESQSPIKIPDRPREEKWIRKKQSSSPSPSSSPIMRSTPDSAQPSWMELAKRKSMAWSDKTMD
ncbi:capping protein-inhibiting regulator of actin dynamics isoform X2 [Corythoichthys intestinalis]|nr:capping protein-inhibiting regulator of actin dynamics isoform X2 [Corythoichthys intestinalis]